MMSVLAGCGDTIAASGQSEKLKSVGSVQDRWNAGIVLAGRTGYLCVSLQDVGLHQGDEIESVTTSCECLSPAVVKYRTPASQTATAILLEYVDDSSHSSGVRKSVALDLAVVVTISLVDGRSCGGV